MSQGNGLLNGIVNFASAANNAQLVHFSSETIGFPCEHILVDDQNNQIWISESKLPQSVIIKVDQTIESHKSICLAGWFCHKKYIFNPRIVKLYVSKTFNPKSNDSSKEDSGIGDEFIHWATMTAEDLIGTHFFKLKHIPNEYCYFKFEFVETFGGTRLYMNKLYLLKDYPDFSNNQSKEDYLLKTPQYNVDLSSLPVTKKPIEFSSSTKVMAATKQLFTGNDSTLNHDVQTPLSVKSRVRFDRRFREAEDVVQRSINRDWMRSRPNLIAPSPAPSLLLDPNYSMLSNNEISASPLVSMSFYGMRGNESFSNRLPPRMPNKPPDVRHPQTMVSDLSAIHKPNQMSPSKTKVTTISPSKVQPEPIKHQDPPVDDRSSGLQETKVVMQSTVSDVRNLETKLESLSASIAASKFPTSESSISKGNMEGISESQFSTMMEGVRECLQRTKDIQFQISQVSDRVRMLEETNIIPTLDNQRNLGFELRRDMEIFKEGFDEKMTQKLKKTMERVEEKLSKSIEAHVVKLMEDRMKMIQKDLTFQISETLDRVRLIHPDNKKIEEYNSKVKFINKKSVAENNAPNTKEQLLYQQQQLYPSSVLQQESSEYVRISEPNTSVKASKTNVAKSSSASTAKYIRNLKEHMDDRSKRLDRLNRAMKSSKQGV